MKKVLLSILIGLSSGSSLDVTFRYVERSEDDFIRVYVPGEMNNWGPNSNGLISPGASSRMIFSNVTDSYEKTYELSVGSTYLYKIHFHHNSSGTDYSWISDPLNPETTNDEWVNSVLDVTDPLFFQPVRHVNDQGLVDGLSVGIFTAGNLDYIQYAISGDTLSGTEYYNDSGIFYVSLDPPITIYNGVWVEVSIDGEIHTAYQTSDIEIVEEPIPDGVVMGPNWLDGSIYLAVFAPSQPAVQVIVTEAGTSGDDSDAILMNKDPNQEDIWWIELDFSPGTYEYEYLLLNGNRIADPFSRRISNGRTRIEIGGGGISTADDYVWQSDSYTRPELDTLVIYELHVDDFAAQGNGQGQFEDVISRLDYLKSTGINAIEFLPITEFTGTHSWGYDPFLMSAVESNYGTPEDFKRLVDEAHLRGIAVIMDMVWNHIRSSSPVWQIQPDYSLNPYIKRETDLNPNETQGSWGMLDWDHFNSHTIEYINTINKIWVEEYRIDGFRFDATRMIGWDLSQPEYGIPAWTDALNEIDPSIYQIAEHLPADPSLVQNTSLTSAWHDSFHDILLSDAHDNYNSAATFMYQVAGLNEYSNIGNSYADGTQAVKYTISHDEQSIIQEMVVFNDFSIEDARKRDKFYATILFTVPGIPMIFQGQEFGLQTGWTDSNGNGDYEEKLQYRPLDWSLLETDTGQSHLEYYSRLASFRKKNPAFSMGTFHDLWRYEAERVIVYGFKDESEGNNNDQLVVIANFSTYDRTINNVPFLSSGTWYNMIEPGNDLITNDGNYGEYFIPAKTAIVYANYDWQLMSNQIAPVPNKFQTIELYPNPFNGQINIDLFVSDQSGGSLSVYDINGRLVKSFPIEKFSQNGQRIKWDAMDHRGVQVSSGVYLVALETGKGVTNKKILFLK